MDKFIVMTASARVSSRYKYDGVKYGKIAIVEVCDPDGPRPKMISNRAKNVERIVEIWDKLYVRGKDTSEYFITLNKAYEKAYKLNYT